ncbi:MAG: DUF4432 family protein [Deinococcota bacterium]
MSEATTRIHLRQAMFTEKERTLLEHADFHITAWQYDSGVAALKISNSKGHVIVLPFHGQQIWRAHLLGRELTMRSNFDEPRNTRTYLENYGGFLLHCGATAMGVPTAEDNHPLHGELPNAPYQQAFLDLGEDAKGSYVALAGVYQHTVAFGSNYLAKPYLKMYEGSSLLWLKLTIDNLGNSPMDLMYMAHINFCPVDNAVLMSSVDNSQEQPMRVRRSIPSHVIPSAEYLAFLDKLEENPRAHETLDPSLSFDPEVVFYIDYASDADGWAHTLQRHPDGSADYVCHRPNELTKGVRWICRTPDKQALGLVLPATAEPEGHSAETRKGNVLSLAAKSQFQYSLGMGALDVGQATDVANVINSLG